MSSSATGLVIPLANHQSADQIGAGENPVDMAPIPIAISMEGESSIPSFRGGTSVYSGVNKAKDKDNLYSSYAYVRKRGRSVYLGRYGNEEEAARAHDIVTLKCSGAKGKLNFQASDYEDIMRMTRDMDDEELIAHIRRSCSRFARGSGSKYRGVTRYAESSSRWFAHKAKKKDGIYLGTFGSEEEAAMAYDIETIKLKGWNAQTNFNLALYDVEGIRTGTINPQITEEVAKHLQQATFCMPLRGVEQYASTSKIQLAAAQNYPSYGICYFASSVDPSFRRYSQIVMDLLSAHPNVQATIMADSSAQQGRMALFNMFRHSSSSPFKPYKRN